MGVPGAVRPRGAPPRRANQRARLPRSASNFLPTAICLGGGELRRDKEAPRQAGGKRGGPATRKPRARGAGKAGTAYCVPFPEESEACRASLIP